VSKPRSEIAEYGAEVVDGQPAYRLASDRVTLAITRLGAMLSDVRFMAGSPSPIRPYATAPWALEERSPPVSPFLHALRGDFLCSAFGDNAVPVAGRRIPVHGDSVHATWHPETSILNETGVALRMVCNLATQGGRCEATTALLCGHTIIYQRHDFHGVLGPINPGHHALLRLRTDGAPATLSFSTPEFAQVAPEPPDPAFARTCLLPGAIFDDLGQVPCADGSETDLSVYPARAGFDDTVIVCPGRNLPFAWSAVTVPSAGYAWFALRSPRLLPASLLWFSNGGRPQAPWNSRHVGVLGVEDVMGYFGTGLAPSSQQNALSSRGIATAMMLGHGERLRIPYIQGIAAIPPGFDRTVAIEADGGMLRLVAASGIRVQTPCRVDFLEQGLIDGLCEP
jgi:hypothetical protein